MMKDPSKPEVALVATLRGGTESLDSFFTYHRAIGFAPIYAFFDDPNDPGIAIAQRHQDVVVTPTDAVFRERQRTTTKLPEMFDFLEREVIARQMFNTETAIEWALAKGISWLLHIDGDELFLPTQTSAPAHFAELEEGGFVHVLYRNHEAAVETFEVVDRFREVTLFKINPHDLWLREGQHTSAPPRGWTRDDGFFLAYSTGKAAVRLHPGVRPRTCHEFRLPEGGPPLVVRQDAAILHYPNCGFASWLEKYRFRGKFPDKCFDRYPRDIRHHLRSRDVFQNGDTEIMREFYRSTVLLEDSAFVEGQLALGNLRRITAARELLEERARAPR